MRTIIAILFFTAFHTFAQDSLEVDKVWAGHQIGIALLSDGDDQFIAYYNADRQMTVGQRKLTERKFKLTVLPKSPEATLGWDSHNYVTIGIDSDGFLHLSGNMHAVPLIYYKGTKARDISSLIRVKNMTGKEESRCTYPRFMTTREGKLLFTYRDGGSGNGNQIYNSYDTKSKTWSRLLDTPLTDGEGEMNAYISLPKLEADGWYHTAWVWRDTPDCATNHDLSHMKSPDLIQWFSASGETLQLPITAKEKSVVVDHTQPKGGLINGGFQFCLDQKKRPTFVFHKYDGSGNIQLYCTRFESNEWQTSQITNWDYRWEFSGYGSINSELKIHGIASLENGDFEIDYWHLKYGTGRIILDSDFGTKSETYSERGKKIENFVDLFPQSSPDLGTANDGYKYELQWLSRGKNRDQSTALPAPPPSQLYLVKSK